MDAVRRFYFDLGPWIALAPIVILIAGVGGTLRMSRHRWLGHVVTAAGMLLTLPAYVWIGGVLDPTTIDYPGPGDGFLVLLYGFFLMLALSLYAAYAWVTRRRALPAL
jgi:hypothetical protein